MNLYRHSDKALKRLKTRMGQEFQNFSVSLPFDELNQTKVKDQAAELFARLNRDIRREYRKIAKGAKQDAEKELGIIPFEIPLAMFITGVLRGYDPVTRYVYSAEWIRKRDRMVEGIMASRGRRELREVLRQTMDVLVRQVEQFGDNITDDMRELIFEEAGVEEVQWNTQRDGKVCRTCQDRDLQIYPLEHVPSKHYHCRCYLTAVR